MQPRSHRRGTSSISHCIYSSGDVTRSTMPSRQVVLDFRTSGLPDLRRWCCTRTVASTGRVVSWHDAIKGTWSSAPRRTAA